MPFSDDPRKMIAYETRGTFRSFENALITVLAGIDVPVAYFHILRLPISDDGEIQKTISEMAFLTPSVTSQLIQKMVSDGLLERLADPNDGRIKKVFLTSKGKELKKIIMSKALEIPLRACEGIAEQDVVTAISVMQHMRKNLEQSDD